MFRKRVLMTIRSLIVILIMPSLSAASRMAPTQISVHLLAPTPLSTETLLARTAFLPAPKVLGNAPKDIPICRDSKRLDQPVNFYWAGMNDVVRDTPKNNWTYYSCGQSRAELSEFYRLSMPKPPYDWLQTYSEDRAEATMIVYYHLSTRRWLHLWFLPCESDDQASYLVAAWWTVTPT